MSDQGALTAGGSTRKRRGAKPYIFLGLALIVVIVLIGVQTGFAGYALAHLRSAAFPRDEALLEYLPVTDSGVLILDPHQVEMKALGAEGSAARTYVERTRADIKKASGIDLFFDVDKLALTPSLVVARGRFDYADLKDRLFEHRYAEADHKGTKILARPGEDAVAVVGGSFLLYGAEAAIRAGIDAEAGDASLAKREEMTDRLAAGGWDHPILGTVQLIDSKPSLRTLLTGFTGPRAVTLAMSLKGGVALRAAIEAASPGAAEELRKLLQEKQADADALKSLAGPDVGPALADVVKRAKITVKPETSQLAVDADVSPEELEKLVRVLEKGTTSAGEIYKNLRLLQLLTPGL